MPCLSNLLNLPPSPLSELKPIVYTRLEPVLKPPLAGEPDPETLKLELNDDAKRQDFGAIGKITEPESAPKKVSGSFFDRLLLNEANDGDGEGIRRATRPSIRIKGPTIGKFVQEWSKRKIEEGIPQFKCSLPFLVGAPKLIQCGVCKRGICPEEKISCSVRGCQGVFHLLCAKESPSFSSSSQKLFNCPQHVCFLCKKKNKLWRCIRCPMACHDKCAPFPEHVIHLPDRPGEAICWRHATDWRLEKHEVPASTIEDIFSLLPLPYSEEDFKIDINWKDQTEAKLEPHPYVHIKRNLYLVKKKRSLDTDIGCTNCSSTQCSDGCVCRVQSISCSKACLCSKNCANRPFQKMKKIQIVKTELCGWGVVAAESISKGEFIVEYVGEVIDDVLCERRLWDMKDQDAKNFYMCEINKDFVIDATLKGNASRFLNHSCEPNCKLEKWQVEGEIRVGVFASRSIEDGEPLTYDYRFVQFGPQVECHCGAPKCRGYLGIRRKIVFAPKTKRKTELKLSWGPKKQRTSK